MFSATFHTKLLCFFVIFSRIVAEVTADVENDEKGKWMELVSVSSTFIWTETEKWRWSPVWICDTNTQRKSNTSKSLKYGHLSVLLTDPWAGYWLRQGRRNERRWQKRLTLKEETFLCKCFTFLWIIHLQTNTADSFHPRTNRWCVVKCALHEKKNALCQLVVCDGHQSLLRRTDWSVRNWSPSFGTLEANSDTKDLPAARGVCQWQRAAQMEVWMMEGSGHVGKDDSHTTHSGKCLNSWGEVELKD